MLVLPLGINVQLKKRIMALEVDFQRACNEEKGFMLFTKEVRRGLRAASELGQLTNCSRLFQELEGVPEDVISGFATVEEGGATKYKVSGCRRAGPALSLWRILIHLDARRLQVTHKTPDVSPLFKYAIQPATRKRANLSYENKTIENAPVLSEITKLRNEAAKLLGYKNHAEWVLEVRSRGSC